MPPRAPTPEQLVARFHAALVARRGPAFRALLAAHPFLANARHLGAVPLEVACRKPNNQAFAEALLAAGADPNPPSGGTLPLKRALMHCPNAVPALLAHGARPHPGVTTEHWSLNHRSDLEEALLACPEHVPALIAAGAHPAVHANPYSSPLATLLTACLQPGPRQKALWALLRDWLDAYPDVRLNGSSLQGAWEPAWRALLRLGGRASVEGGWGLGVPHDAARLCWILIDRDPSPWQRVRGQTFLHAVATAVGQQECPNDPDDRVVMAWEGIRARHSADALAAGAVLEPDGRAAPLLATVVKSLAAVLEERGRRGDTAEEVAQAWAEAYPRCLAWLERFIAIGAVPNESSFNHESDLAHALVDHVPWALLSAPHSVATLHRWGVAFNAPRSAEKVAARARTAAMKETPDWATADPRGQAQAKAFLLALGLDAAPPRARPRM